MYVCMYVCMYIYYFTYNNNTIKILIIKSINYCESNKFSYKIG